jgi:Uma2 family endonuclease
MHIEHYFKNDRKRWTFYEYDDANDIVNLNSFSFQITLEEIYDKVEFESATV